MQVAEQLSLDIRAPLARPLADPVAHPDALGEALIERGYAVNAHLLECNRALTVPREMDCGGSWDLPSRLFRFPIVTMMAGGERRLILRHSLLSDHPYVVRVREDGFNIEAESDDQFGDARMGLWWHAVDLCTKAHWKALLDTRRFTTDEDLIGAVTYGLDYGQIDTGIGRQILAEAGAIETVDRSVSVLTSGGMKPFAQGKSEMSPGFYIHDRREAAWARVHALEDGLVKLKGGFLRVTPKGLAAVARAA